MYCCKLSKVNEQTISSPRTNGCIWTSNEHTLHSTAYRCLVLVGVPPMEASGRLVVAEAGAANRNCARSDLTTPKDKNRAHRDFGRPHIWEGLVGNRW